MVNALYKKPFFTSAPSAEAYLGDLKADGTVPLTANWAMGAFELSQATWKGVAVGAGYGGTGQSSYAVGDLLYASGATALSKLAGVAVGQVLTSGGVGAAPAWSGNPSVASLVLTGTGTLTSTDGNATFTTSLTAASGNEAALSLNYTTNKAAGNDTGLVINQTDTASPGTSYLMDLQVGGASKFYFRNDGILYASAAIQSGSNYYVGAGGSANGALYAGTANAAGTCFGIYPAGGSEITLTSGQKNIFSIIPTYNEASGTASNTDLLINRTETAVGSGTQRLISGQVGSTERVGFDNKGFEIRAYPLTCTHDTATALFGITVAAGSTAGGIITYTLNVTDDDGSDDQIEVGTVQFCGLQDEANWHTNISEVSTQALESGTLATTWAIDTATANTMKITLQATSNLTSPVYTLSYTVTFNNSYVVTTY
jgi:hypothetical protein